MYIRLSCKTIGFTPKVAMMKVFEQTQKEVRKRIVDSCRENISM